jgi:thioredoxin-related protein
MVIERTKKEVIIRLPAYIDTRELQNLINYLTYKEATDKSQAKQADVDKLAKDIKTGWWSKNRRRLIK